MEKGRRVLVAGASGGIGQSVLRLLGRPDMIIGAHYYRNSGPLRQFEEECSHNGPHLKLFGGDLSTQRNCHSLIDSFVEWAGGIDCLVQLTGNVRKPCSWEELTEEDWISDLNVNLSGPFFLAQRAMKYMRSTGGRIILTSTASAKHGGGGFSMAYGVAKAGIDCLGKGLAREGAPFGILVNVIAPGFIATPFHGQTMGRDSSDLQKRAELVPLKRAGMPEDIARLVEYLLSSGGDFITGESIAVSGGDWL